MDYNRLPDLFRKVAVESLFSTPTFRNCWSIWKDRVNEILGENYDESDLIDLGNHLSEIFRTTGSEGRDQGSLSGGGTAWECLVCWYINLCTVGSRTVAFRKMSLVPKPIQDAITVNYGNFACNTESDITIVIFPDLDEYNRNVLGINFPNEAGRIEPILRNKLNPEFYNKLGVRDYSLYEIGVIQCKTNWNDNAQIPMLWDMIYSANGFRGRNITIGREGFNIQDAAGFTYSFVTVPSNQRTTYKSNSVSVKRVTNLSGGNYWGKDTEPHVARSIKEIFTNNYQSGYRSSVRGDIRDAIPFLDNELSYFEII